MKISAHNILKGKITKVTSGAVNIEILLELPGGE
jgi:molybdopterin-binding protein